jgi:hypothetical protein
MNRETLRRELAAKLDQALERAMDAVEAAPDGQWISASEWVVREAFQELTRDCFQAMIQARVDAAAEPAANAAAFSPGGGGGNNARAVQGRAARRRAQRRR